MEKPIRHDRRNLKKRLSLILMIYLDGLNDSGKDRLHAYMDGKLDQLVGYYISLLKKKSPENINEQSGDSLLAAAKVNQNSQDHLYL